MNTVDIFQQRKNFLGLVDAIRAALGYALRNEEPEHGEELAMEMSYGGFDFAIVHSLSNAPDRILIECRFGPLPEGRKQQIMLKLLEMNCMLAERDSSAFCLDPETDEVIYALALDIAGLDSSTVLTNMTEIVWHGRRWLETRYLSEKQDESAALALISLA